MGDLATMQEIGYQNQEKQIESIHSAGWGELEYAGSYIFWFL